VSEPRQSTRRGRILIVIAITVLVLVAAVVGIAVWRTRGNGSTAEPGSTNSATAAPAATSKSPEQEASDKALAAYNGFREAYVAASATADANSPDLAKYAIDPALAQLKYDLFQMNRQGLVTTGRPAWSPRVTSVNLTARPQSVEIKDCLDITNWHTVHKDTGKPAEAPGQAQRFVVTAQAVLTDDGRWLIRQTTADRKTSC